MTSGIDAGSTQDRDAAPLGDDRPNDPCACAVVGIGASAGGLESLERFFAAIPSDTGLCFVVVQHLSPRHRSLMGELLAKHTSMPIVDATPSAEPAPNTVFVMQPPTNLVIRDGRLQLVERDTASAAPNHCIDLLFRSMALDLGERSIGVILSGTGSDGTQGIEAIKQAGGWTLAEDPSSARFAAMPTNAIEAARIDVVGTAEDLAHAVTDHATTRTSPTVADRSNLAAVFRALRQRHRLDFSRYKPATVLRRIERRRQATGSGNAEQYAQLLHDSPGEIDRLASELLIGVTRFFRDPEVFRALRPRLAEAMNRHTADDDGPMRFWVVGCSTGEEAYTIAILAHSIAAEMPEPVEFKVFATDASGPAIDVAARGEYPGSIADDIDSEFLKKYFRPTREGTFAIEPQIREAIVFTRHDVLTDPPFTRLDFVSCRNLMIYLSPEAQRTVLARFEFSLRPNSLLLLGNSESLGEAEAAFTTLDKRAKIFGRLERVTTRPTGLLNVTRERNPRATLHRPAPTTSTAPPMQLASTDLLESLLEVVQPACFVLTRDHRVVYAFGGATEFLRMAPGRLALDVAAVLPEQLALVIGAALDRIWGGEPALIIDQACFAVGSRHYQGRIRVTRLGRLLGPSVGAAVFLDDLELVPGQPQAPIVKLEDAARARLGQLERELQLARDTLQGTVEELEASNEELQSANEELVSSNEELQSTNEELQSLNEELHTVNAELQAKVIELSDLTDDLDNVLESVDAGILLIDAHGNIRRFNRPATYAFNLLKEDQGRPVAYVNHRFSQLDLEREFNDVLESLVGVERKLSSTEGRAYILRVHPMRTQTGEFDGVLLSTNDITALTEMNDRLNLFAAVSEQAPMAQLLTTADGVIQYVNSARASQLDVAPESLVGRDVRTLLAAQNTEQATRALLTSIESGRPWRGHLWISRTRGQPRLEEVRTYPLRDASGGVRHAMIVSDDRAPASSDTRQPS